MGVIFNFLSSLGFATIIPFLVVFIKMGIDSFNMKKIEKVRMTNSKKLMIYVSQIAIFSFLLGGFLTSVLIFEGSIDWKNNEELFGFTFAFSFFTFILMAIVYAGVYHYVQWLSVKTKFNIIIEGQNWSIVRRIDKEVVLLEGEINNFKFCNLSQLNNTEIHEELKDNPTETGFLHWLGSHSLKAAIISNIFIWLSIIFIEYFSMSSRWSIVGYCLFTVGSLLVLTTYVVWKNEQVISRLREPE